MRYINLRLTLTITSFFFSPMFFHIYDLKCDGDWGGVRLSEDASPEMHELGLVEASVLVFVEDLNERHSSLVVVAHRVAYDSDHLVWTQHAVVVAAVHLNTSIPWARFSKLLKKILRRSQENLRKITKLTKILGKRYDNADFQNFLGKT